MRTASFIFALIAFATGLAAAFYWYKSSGFRIGPLGPKWGLPGTGQPIEPLDQDQAAIEMALANMTDLQAALDEIDRAGRLNKIAAALTAVSVLASGISTILADL